MTLPFPTGQVWAMKPGELDLITSMIRGVDPVSLAGRATVAASSIFTRVENVGVIDVAGILTKRPTILGYFLRESSYADIADAVRAAVADPAVSDIILRIDSPGGSVRGLDDAAQAIFDARQSKRVTAFVEDLAASAAYYLASQANRIVSNPSGATGSIGTYTVIHDWSAAFARDGIKTIVIKSGEFKGVGALGAELTDAQRDELQREVNGFAAMFHRAVARGRDLPMDYVRGLADGRVHLASEAQRLRLIDDVQSFDALLGSLIKRPAAPDPRLVRAERVVADVWQCIESRIKTERMTGHFDTTWSRRRAFNAAMKQHGPAIREAFDSLAATGDVRAVAPDLADLHEKLLEREAELKKQASDAAESKSAHERWKRSTIF